MDFIVKMLAGENENNPSSKRTVTFLAFLLMGTAFVAELFWGHKVSQATFDSMSYIVMAGLGFTASEKFAPKKT